jgi:hypothetical protein
MIYSGVKRDICETKHRSTPCRMDVVFFCHNCFLITQLYSMQLMTAKFDLRDLHNNVEIYASNKLTGHILFPNKRHDAVRVKLF